VIGSLLIMMALAHPVVQRLPITTSIIYLLIGLVLGPLWHDAINIDPIRHSTWLLRASEVAVIVSLFTVGMKLQLPLTDRRLRPAFCLAFVSMVLTAGLVAFTAVQLLHLSLGAAVLLGGILAPTDPVLASDVQTRDHRDSDKLRLTLTLEGGLNDGSAFPIVMLGLGLLGLQDLGAQGWRWWVIDGAWAVLGGLMLGALVGFGIGRAVLWLTARRKQLPTLGEYLLLGVIGVSYGVAILLGTCGFLAVFAAGAALRAVERRATGEHGEIDRLIANVSAGKLPPTAVVANPKAAPAFFAGALLATNEQLERILEVVLVLIVGALLLTAGTSVAAIGFAALLFLVIRPLSALPLLLVARFSPFEFGAISWFGIRGIGSIYYLMFAITHGLPEPLPAAFASIVLTIVACSVIVHGVSVTPLFTYYVKRTKRRTR
jgi:NhaP-type Na+/H+ or K+/H+ antiporter